jgi:hypothetical protein
MRPLRGCRMKNEISVFILSVFTSQMLLISPLSFPSLLVLMMIQVDFHEDGLSHQTFLFSFHFSSNFNSHSHFVLSFFLERMMTTTVMMNRIENFFNNVG